jgi:hypothetical protein
MLIKNIILYLIFFSLVVAVFIELKASFAQLGIDEDIPNIKPQNNTSIPPSPSPPPSLPLDPLLK